MKRAWIGLAALAAVFVAVQFKPLLAADGDGKIGAAGPAGKKKVVLVAGGPSHGFGAHDHKSGCMLLAKHLNESGLPIEVVVTYPGWPQDESIFKGADAIVVYADGGGGHPIIPHIKEVNGWAAKGMGVGFIHYGVEVPAGDAGDAFLNWTGGYFEMNWSINPTWVVKDVKLAADHPITRGVHPYEINDEWYYHMRFRPNLEGVTPILSAVPPKNTVGGDGTHSGNPAVRAEAEKGMVQTMMWARQRPDGGRGFGFTGGHVHWNWGNPNHRHLVMNAIAWIAGVEVPAGGVPDKDVTVEELLSNNDEPIPANFDRAGLQKQLDAEQHPAAK